VNDDFLGIVENIAAPARMGKYGIRAMGPEGVFCREHQSAGNGGRFGWRPRISATLEAFMPRLTPSGKKTKLASFEDKVDASKLPGGKSEKYAIANKVGLMRGNKATARGKQAAKRK
jgi:hypothetical protein